MGLEVSFSNLLRRIFALSVYSFRVVTPLLFAMSVFSGCLTYTSAIGDPEDFDENSTGGSQAGGFRGKDAFFQVEQDHQQRLTRLIQSRLAQSLNGARDNEYLIGVGDLIEIQVFDVEELNRRVRVRPTGHISLPLVGLIPAAGMSEEELQRALARRMNEFMHSPQPQVFISEYSSQKVSVIGAVAKPGTYALSRSGYSLIEILSEAGGRTALASGSVVLIPSGVQKQQKVLQRTRLSGKDRAIFRSSGTQSSTIKAPDTIIAAPSLTAPSLTGIEVFFDQLVGSANTPPINVPLKAGDTIIIPEAGSVKVDGEVKKPGSYKLDARTTLLGAIASAGGLTFSADQDEIEVIRELGAGEKALLRVDLDSLSSNTSNDVRLRDGDVVRVPSQPGLFAIRQLVDGFSSLISFGLSGTVGP